MCHIIFICLLSNSHFSVAQTFHAIFLADTKDSDIGNSCQKDLIDMNFKMAKVANSLKMTYNPIVISDLKFGRAALDSVINTLPCSSDDVIFYLYAGHGYALQDRPNLFPLMLLKDDNSVGLDDIHLKLKLKNPRLCVTLGDCCSKIAPRLIDAKTRPINRGVDVTMDINILSILFAKTEGDILICSTQKGEGASGIDTFGGLYTNAWLEALEFAEKTNNDVTWESFLNDSKNRFEMIVKREKWEYIVKQTPQWQINYRRPPIPEPTPKPVVSFDEMNAFLNQLADESQPYEARSVLRNSKKEAFFKDDTQVQIFMDNPEQPLETQPLSKFLSRLMLNAKLIQQVNTIERSSSLADDGKYKILTVQEVR